MHVNTLVCHKDLVLPELPFDDLISSSSIGSKCSGGATLAERKLGKPSATDEMRRGQSPPKMNVDLLPFRCDTPNLAGYPICLMYKIMNK